MHDNQKPNFSGESAVRDEYARRLGDFRPGELVVAREPGYKYSALRADLRTVDPDDVLREYEFKLYADYRALGQVLTYVAVLRKQHEFGRQVRGVLAAFTFMPEVVTAVEVLNLGIELVEIPEWMRAAGTVGGAKVSVPAMPKMRAEGGA